MATHYTPKIQDCLFQVPILFGTKTYIFYVFNHCVYSLLQESQQKALPPGTFGGLVFAIPSYLTGQYYRAIPSLEGPIYNAFKQWAISCRPN